MSEYDVLYGVKFFSVREVMIRSGIPKGMLNSDMNPRLGYISRSKNHNKNCIALQKL